MALKDLSCLAIISSIFRCTSVSNSFIADWPWYICCNSFCDSSIQLSHSSSSGLTWRIKRMNLYLIQYYEAFAMWGLHFCSTTKRQLHTWSGCSRAQSSFCCFSFAWYSSNSCSIFLESASCVNSSLTNAISGDRKLDTDSFSTSWSSVHIKNVWFGYI